MTLAYVFWHRPAPEVGRDAYESRLRAFHAALDVPSAAFRVDALPWADGAAYEDWYLVADWAGLGALNAAAVDARRRGTHDASARLAGEGWGGVWGLVRGPEAPPATARWAAKPAGEGYPAFLARQAAPAVWQRQMVLGPAPEFCLVEGTARTRVASSPRASPAG